MWWLFAACQDPFPEAFEWRIDHTIVPGVAVRPLVVANGGERTVDALVLSPWPVESVSVDVCGLRPDEPVLVTGACFGEPALVEPIADGVPATFTLPALTYPCEPADTGGAAFYYEPEFPCASEVPLRVRAVTAEDAGQSFATLVLPTGDDVISSAPLDPASIALRIDVVSGAVEAGGEVVLEASEATTPENDERIVRWYADDGELLSTGRTGLIDLTLPRATSRNTLRIPDDWHGPLRVAALTRHGTVWTVLTLEVP